MSSCRPASRGAVAVAILVADCRAARAPPRIVRFFAENAVSCPESRADELRGELSFAWRSVYLGLPVIARAIARAARFLRVYLRLPGPPG